MINNARYIPVEDTMRQYAQSSDLASVWSLTGTGGTLSLELNGVASKHPAKCLRLDIAGTPATVGVQRTVMNLQEWVTDELGAGTGSHWVTVFYCADATLAGATLQLTAASSTFNPTFVADGNWHEAGDEGDAWFLATGESEPSPGRIIGVKLLTVPAAGTLRLATVRMRRATPYARIADSPGAPLLPFFHDWASPPQWRYNWTTQLFESSAGNEQRLIMAEIPRIGVDVTFTCLDTREATYLQSLLWGNANRLVSLPLWADALRLNQQANADNVALRFGAGLDVDRRNFQLGGQLVLYATPWLWEVWPIVSYGTGSGQIATGTRGSVWPAGTLAVPLVAARLANPVPLTRPNPRMLALAATFDLPRLG